MLHGIQSLTMSPWSPWDGLLAAALCGVCLREKHNCCMGLAVGQCEKWICLRYNGYGYYSMIVWLIIYIYLGIHMQIWKKHPEIVG